MKTIYNEKTFWTMDETEFTACVNAIRNNGWSYYTYDKRFENCIGEYAMLMDAYGDYVYDCEEQGDEPMELVYYYFDLACSMLDE